VPCAIYHDDDDSAILVHVLRVRPITKARVHVEGSERSPLYRPPARPSDCLSLSLSLRSLHTIRHTAVVERTPRKEFRLYPHYSPFCRPRRCRPPHIPDLPVRPIYLRLLVTQPYIYYEVVPVGPPPAQKTDIP